MVNLLASVQIAIVMVARDLRIRRFTPMAERVLNLVPSDVGRPISHIKPNIDCPDLEQIIIDAIDQVEAQTRDVRDAQGNWYSLRIRPYKDMDNRIDGAVLALFDISTAKRHEAEIHDARIYAEAIVDTVREPLAVLDQELHLISVNRAFCDLFQTSASAALKRSFFDLFSTRSDVDELRALIERVALGGEPIDGHKLTVNVPSGGSQTMLVNARKFTARYSDMIRILITFYADVPLTLAR